MKPELRHRILMAHAWLDAELAAVAVEVARTSVPFDPDVYRMRRHEAHVAERRHAHFVWTLRSG